MKALVVSQLGNPLTKDAERQPLQLKQDVPRPALGSKKVRIEVAAASVNFADILIVQVRPAKSNTVVGVLAGKQAGCLEKALCL